MPPRDEVEVEIVIAADGRLTIEGQDVVLENASVEGDCIVGALRGAGVYVPRIAIPLEMCRMGDGHPVSKED